MGCLDGFGFCWVVGTFCASGVGWTVVFVVGVGWTVVFVIGFLVGWFFLEMDGVVRDESV